MSTLGKWYDEHRELCWLLVLATFFRLSAVGLLTQGGYLYDGHPVYDYQFYRRIGELSLQGLYPSVNYWIEYPPLFSWTILAIYRLSLLLPAVRDPIFWFHNFLGGFLALMEAGNLALIYAIELKLAGRVTALRVAWMYALLFWPLYVMLGWLDPLPLFFLLAAVHALATNRPVIAGLACGLGFMVKLIPAVVAPIALRALPARRALLCLSVATVAVAAVATPFLLVSPTYFLAGFQSAWARSSWETIWAVFEGYFDVGVVAPLEAHADAATAVWQNHEANLPWPLITAGFAGAYLMALWRLRRPSPGATVAFAGLAITLFLLFSKGYSSQFIVYVLPFVLLLLPDGRGIAFAVLLSLVNALQFPLYPMLFRSSTWLLWVTAGLRTLLWVAFALVCLSRSIDGLPAWLHTLRRRGMAPVLGLVGLAMVGLSFPLLDTFVSGRGEYYDLQQYLRPLTAPGQGVVLSSRDLIGYVYPFLDGSAVYVLPQDWEGQQEATAEALRAFAVGRPQVWLVLDYARGEDARQGFLERTLDSVGAKSTNRWFATFRLVGYVEARDSVSHAQAPSQTEFGRTIDLVDYAAPTDVADGDPFRLTLRWQAKERIAGDYSLFVHLVSPDGKIVAQRDKSLTRLGAPTSTWPIASEVRDADDLLVPIGTPPGVYEVRVGLYQPSTGERLKREGGDDEASLGRVQVMLRTPQHPVRLNGAPLEAGYGIRILGYEIDPKPRAGQPVQLALYLQAADWPLADNPMVATLALEGVPTVISSAVPGGGSYPPSLWRRGQIVRQLWQLTPPEPGRYAVGIKMLRPGASGNGMASVPPTKEGWLILSGAVNVQR